MAVKNYYTHDEAIRFFHENGNPTFTEDDLIILVAIKSLNPCFYYNGYITRDYFENNDFSEVKCLFQRYITPSDKDFSQYLRSRSHIVYLYLVKPIETLKLEYPDDWLEDHSDDSIVPLRNKRYSENFELDTHGFGEFGIPFPMTDCRFSKQNLTELLPNRADLDEEKISNNLDEILKDLTLENLVLKREVLQLKNQIQSSKISIQNDDSLLTNPMQKSTVAKMIGKLILKSYPSLTRDKGLEAHGLIEKVMNDTGVTQTTAKMWIELASDKLSMK